MSTLDHTRCTLAVTIAFALAGCAVTAPGNPADARYGLGSTPTTAQIAGWNIDVSPAGGAPAGAGSVAQGAVLFAAQCVACHGAGGNGGPAGQLTGGAGTLATAKPVLTIGSYWPHATTVYDYIHRAMPWDKPGSLTPNNVYALTAYLLNRNGIVAADTVLDAASLARVQMPNRAGFTGGSNHDDVTGTRCMERCKP
jgi:mono/diheme cytochrome c family protein